MMVSSLSGMLGDLSTIGNALRLICLCTGALAAAAFAFGSRSVVVN
jgi:hypothetical protein